MATRALTVLIRNGNKLQTGCKSYYTIQNKIGTREVVGYGINSEPIYIDTPAFPMPAIRYKEVTPDIQALRNKEKGDWKKLTIEEKKLLYRASFRQTFAELDAPTGEWKSILGLTLLACTVSLWAFVWVKHHVSPPLPESLNEENRVAQLKRMIALDVAPLRGLPGVEK